MRGRVGSGRGGAAAGLGEAALIPARPQARNPRGLQPLEMRPSPPPGGVGDPVLDTCCAARAPPLQDGAVVAKVTLMRPWGSARESRAPSPRGPGPAHTWLSGHPRCGSPGAWWRRWDPAQHSQRRRRWQRFCLRDERSSASPSRREEAGPRGHAPRGRCQECSRSSLPRVPRTPPCQHPLDTAPHLRLDRAVWALGTRARVTERRGLTQGRRARAFRDPRGAQGVGLVLSELQGRGDGWRRVEASQSGARGARPGCAPPPPIRRGLQISAWSQGRGVCGGLKRGRDLCGRSSATRPQNPRQGASGASLRLLPGQNAGQARAAPAQGAMRPYSP